MTKNIIGGKKFKKSKKTGDVTIRHFPKKSDFIDDINNFFYAQVDSILGSKYVLLNIPSENSSSSSDKLQMLGIIRGNMYKKEWMNKGDWVLCSNRESFLESNNPQKSKKEKCDIVFKYTSDEVKLLKKMNELQSENNNFNKVENEIINSIFNPSTNLEKIEEIDDEFINNI